MNRIFLHGRIPIWINVGGWKDEMCSYSDLPGSLRVPEYLRRLAMNMTATTRQRGSVTIVDISGRIVLGEESAALRDLVCNLLDKGHRQILFNLADVNYIDSAGLGSLVSAFTSVRKQNGELKLLNLTNKVHDVLQITKLYTVFDIMNDEAEGLSSFGKSTAATA
jgi:anti-sigma B factor antagonist